MRDDIREPKTNDQPQETVSSESPAELESAVGVAVEQATEQVAEATETAKGQVAEATEIAKDQVAEAVEVAKDQVAESANQAVEELRATVEKAKELIADAMQVQVSTTEAMAVKTENYTPNTVHHTAFNSVIKLAKTQVRFNQVIMILIIIGLIAYIVYDAVYDKRTSQDYRTMGELIAETSETDNPSPIIFDLLNLKKEPLGTDATYQQIIRKQSDALEENSISDAQMRGAVLTIINQSDKISALLQANLEALKRSGLSDIKAIPKAFLDENLIDPIMEELPEKMKEFPLVRDFIKEELQTISNRAVRYLTLSTNTKR